MHSDAHSASLHVLLGCAALDDRNTAVSHRFVAIDVETANADLASLCQIGTVTFQAGEIVDAWKTLIDPEDEFDEVNVSIHGIDERMMAGAPRFPDIVDTMHARLANHVVVSRDPRSGQST